MRMTFQGSGPLEGGNVSAGGSGGGVGFGGGRMALGGGAGIIVAIVALLFGINPGDILGGGGGSSNQQVAGNAASTVTAANVDKCAQSCANAGTCVVFEFDFNNNANNCRLFNAPGGRVMLGGQADIVTGRAIYSMANQQCTA